jgi:hypothetical protein
MVRKKNMRYDAFVANNTSKKIPRPGLLTLSLLNIDIDEPTKFVCGKKTTELRKTVS